MRTLSHLVEADQVQAPGKVNAPGVQAVDALYAKPSLRLLVDAGQHCGEGWREEERHHVQREQCGVERVSLQRVMLCVELLRHLLFRIYIKRANLGCFVKG